MTISKGKKLTFSVSVYMLHKKEVATARIQLILIQAVALFGAQQFHDKVLTYCISSSRISTSWPRLVWSTLSLFKLWNNQLSHGSREEIDDFLKSCYVDFPSCSIYKYIFFFVETSKPNSKHIFLKKYSIIITYNTSKLKKMFSQTKLRLALRRRH